MSLKSIVKRIEDCLEPAESVLHRVQSSLREMGDNPRQHSDVGITGLRVRCDLAEVLSLLQDALNKGEMVVERELQESGSPRLFRPITWRLNFFRIAIKNFLNDDYNSSEEGESKGVEMWLRSTWCHIRRPLEILSGSSQEDLFDRRGKITTPVHIRYLLPRDMHEVLHIERETSHENSWREEEFLRCLRLRNCIGMVAEKDKSVVGFMIYEFHRKKLNLLNLAVDPSRHRSGVGTQLVENLFSKLSWFRSNRLSMDVRETTLPAQVFLREMGMHATGIEKEVYPDTGEDAFHMEYEHSPDPQESDERRWRRFLVSV